MTVEDFERRLPHGLSVSEVVLEGGHVSAATGQVADGTSGYESFILWDEEGKASVWLQTPDDERIIVLPKFCGGLRVFRGRMYMRYAGYDLLNDSYNV